MNILSAVRVSPSSSSWMRLRTTFTNCYGNDTRAESYSMLQFPGTYHLAFRDLPRLFKKHVPGSAALDFGCGTGRSTRFLKSLGYSVVGVDISEEMVSKARALDPLGDYRLANDVSANNRFDLILCAHTFDNVPQADKAKLFGSLRRQLKTGGCIVNLAASPDIYVHEWASFSTKDFRENHNVEDGDLVRITMLDVSDRRPLEDIICSENAYRSIYDAAGLRLLGIHRPLGHGDEPFSWVSETTIAPWTIYTLAHLE